MEINLSKKLIPINDNYLKQLKENWFTNKHDIVTNQEFIPMADEWFKSTKLNTLSGWNQFDCVDVIMGCTHYIESFVLKHGWDGFQILPQEYGYYGMMGKFGNEVGNLTPNMPLIVSLPNWYYADIRSDWNIVLRECEIKNIDIHIDFAWITTAKDIHIDLNHPCIKSFAMSMSKYAMQWNRVGLRWSKQRTMDSITIFNHFYKDVNSALTSCGAYMLKNISRDYGWNTYHDSYFKLCHTHDLIPTKMIHVVKKPGDNQPYGVGLLLSQ